MPLVGRILAWLRAAGIRRVILNLHHRAESITRTVGDGSAFDLTVRYSWESEVLGSAGGPARAIPLLEADRFLIVNGDTLANVDLRALVEQHVDTNAMVTLAVVDGRPGYNGVIADDRGVVGGFGVRPEAFHFIGIQAVNAATFAGVSPDVKSETVHGIYPALIASRPEAIRIQRTGAEFFDIGSPGDYFDTVNVIASREGRPLDRGTGVTVAADALVTGSILWDRVTVGAGAVLDHCILADDVVVPAGARYSHSSLVMGDNGLVAVPWKRA
jgi:NDP-sugar pyrophosphorylase family protein